MSPPRIEAAEAERSHPEHVGPSTAPVVAGTPLLRGHMKPLDGVRGVAILMVLALHFIGNTDPTNRFEEIVNRACTFGMFGVDLFFVLSGFLITGILFDARGTPHFFRNFYARRTLRIFPLYYAVLVLVFLVAPLFPFFRGPRLDVLEHEQAWAWLYAINVLIALRHAFVLPYISHFWSLAVEEHFYLVWPLVVRHCTRRVLVGVSLGIIGVVLASRVLLASRVEPIVFDVLTPFRLDTLCLGSLLAVVARGPGGLRTLRRSIVPAAAAASSFFVGSYAWNTIVGTGEKPLHELRNASLTVLLACLMVTALTVPGPRGAVRRFFTSPTLVFFGKYSYGLYAFHHFIAYVVIRRRAEVDLGRLVGSHFVAVLVQALLATLGSVLLAMASYHAFEARFIGLKRFFPSRAGA